MQVAVSRICWELQRVRAPYSAQYSGANWLLPFPHSRAGLVAWIAAATRESTEQQSIRYPLLFFFFFFNSLEGGGASKPL